MKIQVLVSTMHQANFDLVKRMNIQSDTIIVNQCSRNKFEEYDYKGNSVKLLSFSERGVGLSRNNALMRSNADICLMADDDMCYIDGYKDIVIDAFVKNPKADIILFNVPIHKKNGKKNIKIRKNGRVHFYNCLKYGTVNIAFRRDRIMKKNIFFSLLFGGGAYYGSGEDTLFIVDSLKKGLKLYSSTKVIAEIKEDKSTWFTGYNEKYFYDKGALFKAIGGSFFSIPLIIQFLLRKRGLYSRQLSIFTAFNKMIKGSKSY